MTMTDKTIKSIIEKLNTGKSESSIFTRVISPNVEIGKVWLNEPKITDNINSQNLQSATFFFIKDSQGKYVAAVFDMSYDLHWYVLPKYRKQGFLVKALKKAILPYIFEDKDEQQITIKRDEIGKGNYENSKRVAVLLGFKPTNNEQTEFILNFEDFDSDDSELNELDESISEERTEELKREVHYLAKKLSKIHDELKMSYGYIENNKIGKLVGISREIHEYAYLIDRFRYLKK